MDLENILADWQLKGATVTLNDDNINEQYTYKSIIVLRVPHNGIGLYKLTTRAGKGKGSILLDLLLSIVIGSDFTAFPSTCFMICLYE